MAKNLYSGLPEHVLEKGEAIGIVEPKESRPDYLASFMTRHTTWQRKSALLAITETSPYYNLEGFTLKKKKKSVLPSKRRRKTLTSREKKQLKIYDIPDNCRKYEMYAPLHLLWEDYVKKLLGLPVSQDRMDSFLKQAPIKLLKADLHGCIITVSRSKCPSYVGATGIVVQETKNVFKMITRQDRLKTIPKGGSVFTFELEGLAVSVYGNQFRVRASERANKKFKTRQTIDL